MDKEKVPTTFLWDESSAQVEERPLRRPHRPSIEHGNNSHMINSAQSTSTSNSSKVDILSTSKLSVDAKEWFPPNYDNQSSSLSTSSQQRKSLMERIQKIRSPNVSVPESDKNLRNSTDSTATEDKNDEFHEDIHTLQQILITLNNDPAQFHTLVDTFLDTMAPYYDHPGFVADATKLIFEQGLKYPNLRYNAAKICSIVEEQCALFVSCLYIFSEKNYKDNVINPDLALFLAELYNQLKHQDMYGPLLMQVLQCIVSLGTNDSIKAVCQVLKLTGYSLEMSNKQGIETLFKNLEAIKPSLSTNVLLLINSVNSLRASNWGRSQSSPTPTINSLINAGSKSGNESVFYGPDGMELTEEEKQFMFENCDNSSNGDDSDEWEPDPEMDEEMRAAFREFIKLH